MITYEGETEKEKQGKSNGLRPDTICNQHKRKKHSFPDYFGKELSKLVGRLEMCAKLIKILITIIFQLKLKLRLIKLFIGTKIERLFPFALNYR